MAKKTKKARKFSTEFKLEAVGRMAGAASIVGLAKRLGVRRKLLYEWRDRFEEEGRAGLERRRGRPPGSKSEEVPPPAPSAAELRIAELERLLGRKQLEVDFLKRAFEYVRGAASSHTSGGEKETTARSKPRSHSKEKD
jgi:transposase-like protein